jgi:hypothetical protein
LAGGIDMSVDFTGCFLDSTGAMLILAPIPVSVTEQAGIDPVHSLPETSSPEVLGETFFKDQIFPALADDVFRHDFPRPGSVPFPYRFKYFNVILHSDFCRFVIQAQGAYNIVLSAEAGYGVKSFFRSTDFVYLLMKRVILYQQILKPAAFEQAFLYGKNIFKLHYFIIGDHRADPFRNCRLHLETEEKPFLNNGGINKRYMGTALGDYINKIH